MLDRNIWEEKIKKEGIIGKESCPFCKLEKNEKELQLFETQFWEIRYNKYPYAGIKKHILVFPKKHIEITKELTEEELKDLKNIYTFIENFFKNEEYFSFLRERFEGRSIKHLHYHYMPGNIYSSDFKKILTKNYKGKI